MPSKWDVLLESKPVPLSEHVLHECSKLFAKDLSTWPPPLIEVSGPAAAVVLDAARPSDAVLREAFQLARWDLGHEHDAYDEYMRNARWSAAGLSPADKPMLLFLSRFIEEQLLALGEATEGRVDRKAMLRVLDLTERAVLKVGAA